MVDWSKNEEKLKDSNESSKNEGKTKEDAFNLILDEYYAKDCFCELENFYNNYFKKLKGYKPSHDCKPDGELRSRNYGITSNRYPFGKSEYSSFIDTSVDDITDRNIRYKLVIYTSYSDRTYDEKDINLEWSELSLEVTDWDVLDHSTERIDIKIRLNTSNEQEIQSKVIDFLNIVQNVCIKSLEEEFISIRDCIPDEVDWNELNKK